MLGLLGLWIFEACGADISDLGEEHGHQMLRVTGNGAKVVLTPSHQLWAEPSTTPSEKGRRSHPSDQCCTPSLTGPVSGYHGCTGTCCGTPSSAGHDPAAGRVRGQHAGFRHCRRRHRLREPRRVRDRDGRRQDRVAEVRRDAAGLQQGQVGLPPHLPAQASSALGRKGRGRCSMLH